MEKNEKVLHNLSTESPAHLFMDRFAHFLMLPVHPADQLVEVRVTKSGMDDLVLELIREAPGALALRVQECLGHIGEILPADVLFERVR